MHQVGQLSREVNFLKAEISLCVLFFSLIALVRGVHYLCCTFLILFDGDIYK